MLLLKHQYQHQQLEQSDTYHGVGVTKHDLCALRQDGSKCIYCWKADSVNAENSTLDVNIYSWHSLPEGHGSGGKAMASNIDPSV